MFFTSMLKQALTILKKFYGYDAFRPGQENIIVNLLQGHDTVAIMPTGAGKSICFQIPALILPGITLVVSPLISLMKDQVDALAQQGIPATYINSSLASSEVSRRLYDISENRYKLVYVAPERLSTDYFQSILSKITISMLAIDEAHCLSQWGHDFRPSYQQITPFIHSLKSRPIISAFTATATPEVKDDIIMLLGLDHPNVQVNGFDRPNLYFSVLRGEDKKKYIINYVKNHADQSGIIYAATRKEVDSIYELLTQKGLKAGHYHAGISDMERTHQQDDYLYDNIQVMVATNAFGMGIDKSNVRYVIHYNMPKNIEAYYQEAGRSGRDGEPGECILLFSSQDTMTQKFLIDVSTENEERKAHEFGKLQTMVDYCHTPDCLRKFIVQYFGETQAPDTCDNCSNCNDESELVDITVDAQKIFSCIYRMNERFGITMIADVLKGSQNKNVLKFHFDTLSTYGILSERTVKDIKLIIQRLAATQYLTLTESEYPVVKLTQNAYAVMKGQSSVWQKISKERKANIDSSLFQNLRTLRKELAARDNVPPYLVFSDATLQDMCSQLPLTLQSMRQVKGIGERKLEKYGELFLKIIIEQTSSETVANLTIPGPDDMHPAKKKKKAAANKQEKVSTYEQTYALYKQGFTAEEIAASRKLKLDTIIQHFCRLAAERPDESINLDQFIPEGSEINILTAIKKIGSIKAVSAIKTALPDTSYGAIQAVIAKYKIH